jgi:endoglucanase
MPPPGAEPALPLSTCGRWVIDANRRRVKLVGVNWYGASDTEHVVGGLDKVPMAQVARTIRQLGFNSVRLPFSNEMLRLTRPVAAADVAANAATLGGKTPIQVLDATVEALTAEGLLVILNNHSTKAMWCCGFDDDGLWWNGGQSEAEWIADWELVADRYRANPRVVGADLRNEVRIATTGILPIPRPPNWGDGGANDWHAAATKAGNRLLARAPHWLIVVEGINSADDLTGARAKPIKLAVANKLVYSTHQYSFFRPGAPAIPGIGGPTYGDMSATDLEANTTRMWGFLVEPGRPYTAPVWVGEFGDSGTGNPKWLQAFGAYLQKHDLDYAYWALNGGPKAAGGPEPFGLLDDDWTTVRNDYRVPLLQALQKPTRGPGISPADSCP